MISLESMARNLMDIIIIPARKDMERYDELVAEAELGGFLDECLNRAQSLLFNYGVSKPPEERVSVEEYRGLDEYARAKYDDLVCDRSDYRFLNEYGFSEKFNSSDAFADGVVEKFVSGFMARHDFGDTNEKPDEFRKRVGAWIKEWVTKNESEIKAVYSEPRYDSR